MQIKTYRNKACHEKVILRGPYVFKDLVDLVITMQSFIEHVDDPVKQARAHEELKKVKEVKTDCHS
jgi:hypothetical protein